MNGLDRRTVPVALAGLVALVLTMTTACAPGATDVHIDELGDEAEAIGESLIATIDDVGRYQPDGINSGWTWDNVEAGERDPSAGKYWGWDATMELAQDARITPEEAAERMADVLADSDDAWDVTGPGDKVGGGMWEFRRPAERGEGNWYVGINFARSEPPAPQNLSIEVVSPVTSNRSESEKVEQRDAARATQPGPARAAPRANRSGMLPDGTFDANRFR